MKTSEKKIMGSSGAMQRVNYLLERVAESDVDCLIIGETGTGKELAARQIHKLSWRRQGAFIPVNCSALSENLFESELFGHVKGAFTGAVNDRKGRFELADNGTLFLDEIGELSPQMQVKLLRSLQERQVEKVGDSKIIDVNVRIIAASNRNLKDLIKEGSFREDFYYRINVFSICLPPLRKRTSDIPLLLQHFLNMYGGKKPPVLSEQALQTLKQYHWPGNIRQLENAVRHALVLARREIYLEHLPEDIYPSKDNSYINEKTSSKNTPKPINEEKEALIAALKQAQGNRSKTGKILGVSRVTVWSRMKKYDLLPQKEKFIE